MATLAGRTLGKYQVIERIGRGGMAEVYKGHHARLDRHVAIKVLHSHLAEGEDFLARFEREARAVAALRHPHIVQVYDFDAEDDLYYMVMEFIDGGTLKARLSGLAGQGRRLPLAEAQRLFRQVAEALHYAHCQGMIHRDVKPANVLLDGSGRAFLTDFGIARILSSSTQFTATGTLIGTPAYMSPEQGQGLPPTVASDIYSLGVVLYELVTGRVPFEADTPLAIIHMHVHEPLPAPRSFRPEIPEALEQVILTALAKEPGDRYQSAAEMLRAVDQALAAAEEPAPRAGQPDERPTEVWQAEPPPAATEEAPVPVPGVASAKEPPATRVAAPATTAMEEPPRAEPPPPPPRPGRRIKPLPIALAIVGVAVVVALAVVVPQLLGGAACAGIGECRGLAVEAAQGGDLEGAIGFVDQALSLVPGSEHPPFADLWCQRGDLCAEIGDNEGAIASYEECISWTQNDPEMEPLRINALQRIRQLEGR